MRAQARPVLLLALLLGGLAVATNWGLNRISHGWLAKDLRLRAELAARAIHDELRAELAAGAVAPMAARLERLAQDQRILAAGACDGRRLIAHTQAFPPSVRCPVSTPPEGRFEFRDGLHVATLPLGEGSVVIIHDVSYAERRDRTLFGLTLAALALLAAAAAALTVLTLRGSLDRFVADLRRQLRGHGGAPSFHPILRDVRELAAEMAAEARTGESVRWTPERLRHVLRRDLHGERIILVANREPYIHVRQADKLSVLHPASGLVTAVEPVMRACSGVWIAHGAGSADRETADEHGRIRVPPREESYSLRRIWLSPEEERGYYYGFANEGLWPLCHVVHVRPSFRADDFRAYLEVNTRFADAVLEEADVDDPVVLVQDYHFALLPALVRERLPRATILTFWHIPWPNAERFGMSPWHRPLLEGLLGSSIVGFHTQSHCNNFIEAADRFLENRIDRESQAVISGGRTTLVRAYPISIDWPPQMVRDAPTITECRTAVLAELGLDAGVVLGVGVERLDYTKGIVERFLAVERLLELRPDLRGRFFFAQLAAPSRAVLPEYRALNEQVAREADRINRRFADGGRDPIRLFLAHHEPPRVACFLRAADLCYVSSLHDGMNLVAKEFVAARDDERGVLVLSRFTGAARELSFALLVNPYDIEESAHALAAAVAMSPEEQTARMRALRNVVAEFNIYRWAGRQLVDAARVREQDRLRGRWG